MTSIVAVPPAAIATIEKPLRLMIYDTSDRRGLSHSWFIGGALYQALRRLDDCAGFDNWFDALTWISQKAAKERRKISQIQYWGHGWRGMVSMNGMALRADAFQHPVWSKLLSEIRWHLAPDALIWFRTCGTFGGAAGHEFARAWTTGMNCRVAAHTHLIGPFQSGLHSLTPRTPPYWPQEEGVEAGSRMAQSSPWRPNTITCLHGTLPEGW
jgi:hypothetical protein